MNELIMTLKSYIILSLQDLTNIKNTIHNRYTNLSSTERAQILSMAVHNLLDKHMAGVEEQYRENLKLEILANTLVKHIYSINRFDIFDSILKLELDEGTRISLAESWLSESVQIPVPRWALENYLMDEYQFSDLSSTENPYFSSAYTPTVLNFPKPIELNIHGTSKIRFTKGWRYRFSYDVINRFIARNFAIIALLLGACLFTTFLLSWFLKPSVTLPEINLTTHMDYREYSGISSVDKVYLLDLSSGVIEYVNVNKSNHKTLSMSFEKKMHPFGLTSQLKFFKYERFDYFSVKAYISTARNGLIGKNEHFNEVVYLSYLNDIDPLLLLAIIGQEQAFIPANNSQSEEIINNPYNVYHSWTEYNTTLRDSTQIAINTIKRRLSTAPVSVSPFVWLNNTYAEDTNWNNGVRLIYTNLLSIGRP
ncbi:hypothetical protein [Fusibacter bizertensis]